MRKWEVRSNLLKQIDTASNTLLLGCGEIDFKPFFKFVC